MLDTRACGKAASIETGGGSATTSVGWGSFKQDFDTVFAKPWICCCTLPSSRTNSRSPGASMETGISRRNDEAEGIAGREATQARLRPGQSLRAQAEYATVAAVTLDDLKAGTTAPSCPTA